MSPEDLQNVLDSHKLGSYSVERQGMFLLSHVQNCHRKTEFKSRKKTTI